MRNKDVRKATRTQGHDSPLLNPGPSAMNSNKLFTFNPNPTKARVYKQCNFTRKYY